MSSAAYALPLRLERQRSRGLAWTLLAVHGLAVAVLPTLAWPWWLKSLLAVAVVAQGIVSWRRHVQPRAPTAIRTVLWKSAEEWELTQVDGRRVGARLRRASYVQSALVILRFKTEDGRRVAVLLPADGVDRELHRRLRVGLRLQAEVV